MWPKKEITGLRGEPYLTRYYLSPMTRWGQLLFHVFHDSDPGRAPHDHPFNFLSLVLRGRYVEFRYRVGRAGLIPGPTAVRRFGSLAYRTRRTIHVVILPSPVTKCWTLVWRSRYKVVQPDGSQGWGFYLEDGTYIPCEKYWSDPAIYYGEGVGHHEFSQTEAGIRK